MGYGIWGVKNSGIWDIGVKNSGIWDISKRSGIWDMDFFQQKIIQNDLSMLVFHRILQIFFARYARTQSYHAKICASHPIIN